MVTAASSDRITREFGSRCSRAVCSECEQLHATVQTLEDQLARARADVAIARESRADADAHRLAMAVELDAERNRHQCTVLELEVAIDNLGDTSKLLLAEQAEVLRLKGLHARVAAQLADASQRLIDVSFEHAKTQIRRLREQTQSMMFDVSDVTVVDDPDAPNGGGM